MAKQDWEEIVKLMIDNGADPKVEDVLDPWEIKRT